MGRRSSTASDPPAPARGYSVAAIPIALVLLVFAVYAQAGRFGFTYYDDPDYVTKNIHVQGGLTVANIAWAWHGVVSGNWSPLTMLSHIAAFQGFGMDSGMHHLVNVLFHALAGVLLFAALRRATGAQWASAFVAAAFAVHPLHVESVAWVAERKDVLSAFFWFLGLYAYVRYSERPNLTRYALVAGALCLGLLSKTMLVTFPFTLLLFDEWPLRRARYPKTLWEKLPLIVLCGIASAVAYSTQKSVGAISAAPLTTRIENALLSYVTYIGQTIWPAHLSPMYPYPESIPAWQAAIALVVLAAVSSAAVIWRRQRPYLSTGWFFYLGTLAPVIGLIQIGATAHADRYTYIPMTGLAIAIAWGAKDVIERRPELRVAIASFAAVCVGIWTYLAWAQTAYWQDGVTLFQHAVDIAPGNYAAKYQLSLEHYLSGKDLLERGQRDEAIEQFQAALRVRPNWAEVHNNLGIQLGGIAGRAEEARVEFETAARLDPRLVQPRRNLGLLLANIRGKRDEAIANLEAAQRLQADAETQKVLDRLKADAK